MSKLESALEAEITHLIEMINLLREEVESLQRDVYLLQCNQHPVSHIGTFIK